MKEGKRMERCKGSEREREGKTVKGRRRGREKRKGRREGKASSPP